MNGPGWGIVALIAVVCMIAGGVIGFIVGVATSGLGKEIFDEAVLIEQDADVANPLSLDRAGFELQYPGNWTIDRGRIDYDPDHFFYIDTPGGSYVEITVEQFASDPLESLEEKIEWHVAAFNSPEYARFDTYGAFTGEGREVKNRGLGYSETYRFFSYSEGEKTLIVTEYIYEMDREMVARGFDLVERTLRLR